jgi:hypothetical protein
MPVREQLLTARDRAEAFIDWTATFPFPDKSRDCICVSLRDPVEYPMNRGRIVSNRGQDMAVPDYNAHFHERRAGTGMGVAEAVGLAKAPGRIPERLAIHAIECAGFALGAPLHPAVQAAIAACVDDIAAMSRQRPAQP